MTDETIKQIIDKSLEMFGDLPDPEVFPKQFVYFLRLAAFELKIKSSSVV